MNNIKEILDSITTARNFKTIHIETICSIYLDEDIDPEELFPELKRFASRTKQPYAIVEAQIHKQLNKLQCMNPDITLQEDEEDLFTQSDMEKPWEITEELGYMVYQDIHSQKNNFYIKSVNRVGDKKVMHTKADEKSLISFFNALTFEHKIQWNRPQKVNGQIVDLIPTIVDFRETNLTRFAHKEILFDPKTTNNFTNWHGKECLNSYLAPKILSKEKQKDVDTSLAWDLEIADFFRLIWNLVSHDDKGQLYVIDWLAKNYQTKEPAQNFLWFCGESGTGKGALILLLENIYGEDLVGIGKPKNNIFEASENNELKNKLYYQADEIKITDEIWEASKGYIANDSYVLKALFEDRRKYPNYASFIFNNNMRKGHIPFSIPTEEDRRVSAFESYSVLPKDTTWWNPHTSKDKFKHDKVFANQVAQFLGNHEYNKKSLVFPYSNDLRRRMLLSGKPNIEKFAECLANNDMDWLINHGLDAFEWMRADGTKASTYTWEEHMIKAFEDGYISTKSAKTLYSLIFGEYDKDYKKDVLFDNGIVEKPKRIEIQDEIKVSKVFVLPRKKIKSVHAEAVQEKLETSNFTMNKVKLPYRLGRAS